MRIILERAQNLASNRTLQHSVVEDWLIKSYHSDGEEKKRNADAPEWTLEWRTLWSSSTGVCARTGVSPETSNVVSLVLLITWFFSKTKN